MTNYELQNLQSDVSSIKSRLYSFSNEESTNRRFNQLGNSINSLEERISSLESQYSDLERKYLELENLFNELKNSDNAH